MAAYSAVVSFEQLLKQLLDSDQFPPDYPKSQVELLYTNISSLQSSIDNILPAPKEKRTAASELENRIRKAVYNAQDAIESSMIPPQSGGGTLEEIIAGLEAASKEAKEIADSINKKTSAAVAQTSDYEFVSRSEKIVGQEKDKKKLQDELLNKEDKLLIIPISGMAGIGKTTLAKSIYEDEDIKAEFRFRAWVTVTQDANLGDILTKLLDSMRQDGQPLQRSGNQENDYRSLLPRVRQDLYEKKFLVVVDDMWDKAVWDLLKHAFQDDKRGSRILLTTRSVEVAEYARLESFHHEMQPLSQSDSWILLSYIAFNTGPCPDDAYKEIGDRITKSCGGLPLALIVVGGLLAATNEEDDKKDDWRNIADDVSTAVGNNPISESYKSILFLSYIHLPGFLKGCFLYMGLFPEDSEIVVSKIIQLWTAEGFINQPKTAPKQMVEDLSERVNQMELEELQTKKSMLMTFEHLAKGYLKNLIDRNLIAVRKSGSDNRIKACGLHDTLRDLAVGESTNELFFHSVRKYNQEWEKEATSHRRVSVHKNVLMCLEKVYDAAKTVEGARSLLYVGPHHHHPLPTNLSFKLLRVFDAYTIYFIEFPNEISQLLHLRYLSLTYNGKLPSFICDLRSLQILMVRRQPKIVFIGASYLPDGIWKLADLRHVFFTDTDLPDLSDVLSSAESIVFANLQTLSSVRALSCTEDLIKNAPNLTKLGIWMEKPCEIPFHIHMLDKLDSFKFTVLNPVPGKRVDFNPQLSFPKTVRKLSLSGCSLPWEDLEVIRKQLPDLEVLKLRELAFHGDEWVLDEDSKFRKLKFLLIEYLNFTVWDATYTNFPMLERLIMKHCYNLEAIHPELGDIGGLKLIEMIDCSPKAVEWVKEIKAEKKNNKDLKFTIYSSWE